MSVKRIDYRSKNAPTEFVNSLRETGFAVLYNHPISEQDTLKLYQEWERQFFDLPPKEKEKYLYDPVTQAGWAPPMVAENH